MKIKQLQITKEQLNRAKEHYNFKCLNNSITQGNGNIYGALGEIIVFDYYKQKGLNIDLQNTYDYDLIIENRLVDVKTKHTTVSPQPNYFCSIASFNTKQRCHYYFFTRITKDLSICYLLGYKNKSKFFKQAKFYRKGEIEPNTDFTFKADCFNLEIGKLEKIN